MLKKVCLTILACAALAAPAFADDDIEYPAPTPCYPFQRSTVTNGPLYSVRVYTTPQRQPYYNVPPYPVITPY